MAGTRLSRREFVRAAGATAGAATLGANIIIPGRARAAKSLKISRAGLYNKMREYELS